MIYVWQVFKINKTKIEICCITLSRDVAQEVFDKIEINGTGESRQLHRHTLEEVIQPEVMFDLERICENR